MRFLRKHRQDDGWLALAHSGDGVHAAVVERAGAGLPQVKAAAWFDSAASGEALERVGKQMRAAQARLTCLLAAGEYQLLALEAPAVPPDELKTAVRWMLKDMLDYPVDDATIDVLTVPAEKSGGQRSSMFAVAARNSVIEARQRLFTAARLALAVIDIPELAQRNIAALLEAPGRGLAMLSFGTDGCLLTVTFDGELLLARRLEVALADLLADGLAGAGAVAGAAGEAGEAGEQGGEGREGAAPADTTDAADASDASDVPGGSAAGRGGAPAAAHLAFDKLTLLLQRSLDHFERQFHTIALSRLVLAPSAIKGLAHYLGSNLYTPVHALDLHEVFDLARAPLLLELAEQQRFFLALGAALRQER